MSLTTHTTPSTLEPVLRHYGKLLRKYGDSDPRSLNWAGGETQWLRFVILSQIADLSECSVLDAGCGLGDFLPFLRERFPRMRYTGMDINPDFIDICQQRYPHDRFVVGNAMCDLHEHYDYILASGTFGFAIDNYRDAYLDTLRHWYEHCNRGIGANFLNKRTHAADPLYATFDPLDLHAQALALSSKLILRQDYLDHDITVFVYRKWP